MLKTGTERLNFWKWMYIWYFWWGIFENECIFGTSDEVWSFVLLRSSTVKGRPNHNKNVSFDAKICVVQIAPNLLLLVKLYFHVPVPKLLYVKCEVIWVLFIYEWIVCDYFQMSHWAINTILRFCKIFQVMDFSPFIFGYFCRVLHSKLKCQICSSVQS